MVDKTTLVQPFGNLFLEGFAELPGSISEPVSHYFWPLTPAWHVVFIVLISGLAWQLLKKYQTWQANGYRREALKHLAALTVNHTDNAALIRPLALLIKTTALHVYPRQIIAPISGENWLGFLNEQAPTKSFSDLSVHCFGQAIYQKNIAVINNEQRQQLVTEVELWLKTHCYQCQKKE